MTVKGLIERWFEVWENGDYLNIPVSDNFKHTSPFGIIDGKHSYLELVKKNEDKFLGQSFEIHDMLFEKDRACVRYTARQGEDFSLDVSEWYYIENDLIKDIVAFYHIGDIRKDRQLDP